MRWSPEHLASATGGRLVARSNRPIAEAFIDSRAPVHGGLFVPIVADRDGHDFIAHAVAEGAAAVLQGRGRPVPAGDVTVVEVEDTLAGLSALARDARARIDGPVVAITGSNGKTTTRAMVAAVLEDAIGDVLCTRGNLNNHLGVPLTLCGTPHAPRAAVVEIGMNAPGEVDRLAAIVEPTVAIITSIALEHVEFLGSLEAIADAESEVVRHVAPGGAIIIPSDEPLLTQRVDADGPASVLRFGPDADADVRIEDVRVGARTRATLRPRGGPALEVVLQPFGAHNARNAAAAVAVAVHLGQPLAAAAEALAAVEPVGDRGKVIECSGHLLISDCYNANPGSMEAALRSLAALRGHVSGPLVAVLGDMLELGEREAEFHAQVGGLVADLGIDRLVTLGSRSEGAAATARSRGVDTAHFADDVTAAAAHVVEGLDRDGAAILVKASRGARLERVVEGIRARLDAADG